MKQRENNHEPNEKPIALAGALLILATIGSLVCGAMISAVAPGANIAAV